MINKECIFCKIDFIAKRKDNIFCTRLCKRKALYHRNKEKYILKVKKYQNKNPSKVKLNQRKQYLNNTTRYLITSHNQYKKIINDPILLKKRQLRVNKRQIHRRKVDNLFNLTLRVRQRIYSIFLAKGWEKDNTSKDLIGCSPEELKLHLETQFSEGMDWDNKGDWHIDHIKPLAIAKSRDELINLCHYTNLQPLWAEDNMKKSSTYEDL